MVIAVAGLVFGAEAARGQPFHQISGMLGRTPLKACRQSSRMRIAAGAAASRR
jgi:hypothetical protein